MRKKVFDVPELMSQWDFTRNKDADPKTIAYKSSKVFWWVCSKGHHWKSSVATRHKGMGGCKYCSRNYPWPGETDLGTENPELSLELLDQTLSTKLMVSSGQTVFWVCTKYSNHIYDTSPARRSLGEGCPYCSGNRVLQGFNDLWSTEPGVASELEDPMIGYLVTRQSAEKHWFVCNVCSYRWNAMIYNRTSGKGCHKCSKRISRPETALGSLLEKDFEIVRQYKVDRFIPDFYIPTLGLIIEYDGAKHHYHRLDSDITKTKRLLDLGYKVVRLRELGSKDVRLGKLDIDDPNLYQLVVKYKADSSHINQSLIDDIVNWSKTVK